MLAPRRSSVWLTAATVLLLQILSVDRAQAFTATVPNTHTRHSPCATLSLVRQLANKDDSTETDTTNPLTKASWYAAEALGKVFGGQKQSARQGDDSSTAAVAAPIEYDLTKPPLTVQETLDRIKEDNEREYFLSGTVDKLIYDEECEFADPFVSFKGRDRFVENLANLGSFITEYSAKPLSYEIGSDQNSVETKFMVKLELNLPWKPVLVWPWGVLCEIDPQTNLVVLHKESWDIEAWEGVKQVFRKPTTTVS